MADTKLPNPKNPGRPVAQKCCTSSAWCVTSTWRCICPCAMKTKRVLPVAQRPRRRPGADRSHGHRQRGHVASAQATAGAGGRRHRYRELRFFSFYPSHQKTLAVGLACASGAKSRGFWGRQMLHPTFRVAGGDLPTALTPVYPTTAGLSQPYLAAGCGDGLAAGRPVGNVAPGVELPWTKL